MNSEQEITEKIKMVGELVKKDPKIDATALMMNAFAQAQHEEVAAKKRRLAYLVSAGLPPLGLLFALRYWLKGSPGGKHVAKVCLLLTLASLLITWGVTALFLASLGPQLGEMENSGNLDDLKSLLQP